MKDMRCTSWEWANKCLRVEVLRNCQDDGLEGWGMLQNRRFKSILQDREPEGAQKGGLKGRLMMESINWIAGGVPAVSWESKQQA